MNKNELAKKIKETSLKYGDFTLRSGKKSCYYLDKYLFESNPAILSEIIENLTEILPALDTFDKIAAQELGAVAIASALSVKTKKPFIIVRKEKKDYGTKKEIEGNWNPEDRVLLVEDVITSGSSVLEAAKKILKANMKIVEILGIVDRCEGAKEKIKAEGFKYKTLFTIHEILETNNS